LIVRFIEVASTVNAKRHGCLMHWCDFDVSM